MILDGLVDLSKSSLAVAVGIIVVTAGITAGVMKWLPQRAKPQQEQRPDVVNKAPPIAKKLRDAFVVSFEIDYHYPEEQETEKREILEKLWNDTFFGRQPPMFLSRDTGQPKLITPPRAVQDRAHRRVSEGKVIFALRYEPRSREFQLEGRGFYTDWLDTGEEDRSARNPQDSRYIRFTWGITVSFEKRHFKGDLRDDTSVDLHFMLSGAGAETHFIGGATLSAESWIKEQEIELFFVRSDRFTDAENAKIRDELQRFSISLSTLRIDWSESRPLGSDEWWQGFDLTQES